MKTYDGCNLDLDPVRPLHEFRAKDFFLAA